MNIEVEWHDGQYPSFNIALSSRPDTDPFITIKGCKIVSGSKGDFISYPSRKQENGKYWNHVYGSDAFNAAVLEKALSGMPRTAIKRPSVAQRPDRDYGEPAPF